LPKGHNPREEGTSSWRIEAKPDATCRSTVKPKNERRRGKERDIRDCVLERGEIMIDHGGGARNQSKGKGVTGKMTPTEEASKRRSNLGPVATRQEKSKRYRQTLNILPSRT